MDPDDERCKSGPIKPLNISRTLCHPYLATLVGITLCNVIMSQNGDITSHPPKRFTHFHKESHPPKRFQKYHKVQRKEKDFSSYQCYHCDKMGHILKNCPARGEEYKKRNNKRHHAHATEDDEPPKKVTKEEIEDYILFFALSGSVTPGEDTWLIDNGASKHMTG
jgi:hypothetical protein